VAFSDVKNLSKLFGSSGVRSLVNVDLTPFLAAEVGLAVATFSKANKALVARDTRVSGLMLENALVSGLISGGTNVESSGILPTPVLAFLTKEVGADAGIMITASHNPPQYNGIKIFNSQGLAYDEKEQNEIERIIEHKEFKFAGWQKVGETTSIDQNRLYTEKIEKTVKLNEKWHVVVDPGCGATYALAPEVMKYIGCTVTALNAQPDGFFPARSAEPNAQSLLSLARIVKAFGADLGLAYDGDGDRVAFIDEKGETVNFDRALAAYAGHVTKEKGGGTVVTNVEASMCIERMVVARGGKVVRTRVGDVYVSEAMKRHRAIFGGEPCGAWIHPQFHYCPDGILSSALLLKALEDEGKRLSELIAETPQYPTLRENVACENDVKYEIVEKVGEDLKSIFPGYQELSTVDGVRMVLENGWILVRASGTEPMVRLTAESESLNAAREIMKKGAISVKNALGRCNR
jgi:phosphoglucosamine mutase